VLSRPSAASIFSVLVVIASWTALTIAHAAGRFPTNALAATPARVAQGQVWRLLTSGLVVQRPIVLSLVSFVLLAVLVVVICGPRLLWLVMILGHVCSTLVAYGLLPAVSLVDHAAYTAVVQAPDYGVSAIAAAWLGAVACTAWMHRGSSARGKAAVLLSCAAVAVFAFLVERHVQRHLTFLDSEHVFAFAVGVLAVAKRWRFSLAALVPARALKAPATD
jgi:hypothetical protein